MTKTDVVKEVLAGAIGLGVSYTVGNITKALIPRETFTQKMLVGLGAYGITIVVADQVGDSVDKRVDMVVDVCKKLNESTKTE